MSTTNAISNRSAELQAAIRFVFGALQEASVGYDRLQPEARARVGKALVAAIHLISEVYPKEPSFAFPLNDLLYGLFDLDHGKVVPLLRPVKIANSPGNALVSVSKLIESSESVGFQRRWPDSRGGADVDA
jgi:hypothetical protein